MGAPQWTMPAKRNLFEDLATDVIGKTAEDQYQRNRFARKQENIKNALAQFQDADDVSPISYYQAINGIKDLDPEEKKSLGDAYKYYSEQKTKGAAIVQKQAAEREKQLAAKEQDSQSLWNYAVANKIDPTLIPEGLPFAQGQKIIDSYMEQKKDQEKEKATQEKSQRDEVEQRILAKKASGEEVSDEELAQLSPTSLRSLIGAGQSKFEPAAQAQRAKDVAEREKEVNAAFRTAEDEDLRLNRMEELVKKGNLTTPAMVKALDKFGLPLGVLGNPDTEEYAKLEADFIRNVNNTFRGAIRVFEIQSYLKTIPGLLNSDEGKKIIIRNRRLMNEMAKVTREESKKIIKENKGYPPPDYEYRLEERTKDKRQKIADEFEKGITKDVEKFQPSLTMVDDSGKRYKIPHDKIPAALKKGMKVVE